MYMQVCLRPKLCPEALQSRTRRRWDQWLFRRLNFSRCHRCLHTSSRGKIRATTMESPPMADVSDQPRRIGNQVLELRRASIWQLLDYDQGVAFLDVSTLMSDLQGPE